jgi:hypothetical protein
LGLIHITYGELSRRCVLHHGGDVSEIWRSRNLPPMIL